MSGTVTQSQTASGLVDVNIALSVANPTIRSLGVRIEGQPIAGGGVQMSASSVALGTTADPTLYRGSVTSLEGTNIGARVTSTSGRSLVVGVSLQIDAATGTASGAVQVAPSQ